MKGDIRDNVGHSSPETDFEPTIILMNTDIRQPVTGNLHLRNNTHYELDNQLSLTELAVHQSSVITSSQTGAARSVIAPSRTGTVAIKHNTRNKTIYTGRVAGNCAQQAKNSCS